MAAAVISPGILEIAASSKPGRNRVIPAEAVLEGGVDAVGIKAAESLAGKLGGT
jgi:hypothetical protein